MKLPLSNPSVRQQGASLIECLVYFALFALLLGVATSAFFRCWDDNKHLRRNAGDIVQALHAGEQWRADVRAATQPIRVTDQDDAETVVIPVKTSPIIYTFSRGELHRQAGASAPAIRVLDQVKASRMQADPRPAVAAWRWELELRPTLKQARTIPLFTFETVAGHTLAR
jgi:Tfp pilus assembly protein FimT